MPNPQRYRFTISYTDADGKLRTKEKDSSGATLTEAAEKMKYQWRHLGKIEIIKWKRLKANSLLDLLEDFEHFK
jgi:hypothetical protein